MKALVTLDSYGDGNDSELDLEDGKYPTMGERFETGTSLAPYNYRIDIGANCVLLCDDEYFNELKELINGN